MKVSVDGKEYCVETLLSELARLKRELASEVELHNKLFDNAIKDIEKEARVSQSKMETQGLNIALEILEKYKGVCDHD